VFNYISSAHEELTDEAARRKVRFWYEVAAGWCTVGVLVCKLWVPLWCGAVCDVCESGLLCGSIWGCLLLKKVCASAPQAAAVPAVRALSVVRVKC
jgi:hypothetical protein